LSVAGPPLPGRAYHTAVYDADSNRMIVFGGQRGDTLVSNDVWVLTNANGTGAAAPTWIQLPTTGAPPARRMQHTAVYDPGANRMIVFGGADRFGGTVFNDVWVLTNANGTEAAPSSWLQATAAGTPPAARWRHTAVYDATHN